MENILLKLLKRITLDSEICHAKPCIRGLRYPVEVILELIIPKKRSQTEF